MNIHEEMNKIKKVTSSLIIMLLLALPSNAAKTDTIKVHSNAMGKDINVVVITPKSAMGKKAIACPAIYMLHGFGGNEKSWIEIKPDLGSIADKDSIILVCPDGNNSWYFDSPKKKEIRYETFISKELIEYIDAHYKTIGDRKARAITGLSMGGHGALYNAMRHKDMFGAAGSTSGGVDIRPFPLNWNIADQLGEMAANKQSWDEHTVVNQVSNIKDGDLAIIFDCGESDFFLEVNKSLHQRLLGCGISHDFITRPGGHTHEYWNNSIDFQILFFKKFFDRNN